MKITPNQITNQYLANTMKDKTNTKTETEKKTDTKSALEIVKKTLFPEESMTDEEKKKYESKINQKIENGDKLSNSELEYIRRTNPERYYHIKRVQMMRELLKERLKHCKSKREVNDTYFQTIGGIDKKDPDKKELMAAYDNVTKEFKKSAYYKNLPEEEKKEKDKKTTRIQFYKKDLTTKDF